MSPEDVVARQVAAYNAHDLDAFVACYTDDVLVSSGTGQVRLDGADAFRQRYGALFRDLPDVHAHVLARIAEGPWVVDKERATAASRGLDTSGLMAYRVQGDRIDRVVTMTA